MFGKLQGGSLNGRKVIPDDLVKPTNKSVSFRNSCILDYILAHAKGDRRPYLNVKIFGKLFLGLLDSGSSHTILGKQGWEILRRCCRLEKPDVSVCTVANGQDCAIEGVVSLPIQLEDKIEIIQVIVVPSVPHMLILGTDFWSRMKIVPDLHSDVWTFQDASNYCQTAGIRTYDDLTPSQQQKLSTLVDGAFAKMKDVIGCTALVEHTIRTESPPIKQRHYPISPTLQKQVNLELDEMLKAGIVEPSMSPWSSPIVLIKKKDGRYRFCVDYRRLNQVSLPDAYPLPFVNGILDKLRDGKYLTTLDIRSAYWQIPMAETSKMYTAFTVPNRGLFQFRRMPYGLHNSPATWQRLMDRVFGDLEAYVFIYLDDIIICTPTFEQHLEVLEEVLDRLIKAGLTLNRDKCIFCKPELRYLGYIVNSQGLMVDPEKVNAILQIPTPRNTTEVRRIVGLASWYRRFVPNFSTLIAPMTALLRKNKPFSWDEACAKALEAVKKHLVSAPILTCPNFDLPFTIHTDASDYGLGAVLTQVHPEGEKVICYLSRSLTKNERKYSVTEKELLAVLFAIEKLRPYIEGTKFTVITDHFALKWLHNLKDPCGRLARLALRLQQYDFDVVHRQGKDHIVPDVLSRVVPEINSIDDDNVTRANDQQPLDAWYESMRRRILDHPEKYPTWRVESDVLYKRLKPKYPDLEDLEQSWKRVVSKAERKEIIRKCHDPPTCGHLGVTKTVDRVARNFYWPKMRTDVAKYVRACRVCLQIKPPQHQVGEMLSATPTVSRPWKLVSIDIIGPLPRTTKGYAYILSVADCFSKFVLLFPLRSADAPAVTERIENDVILMFGAPEVFLADNGVQFRSKKFLEMTKIYNIKVSFRANYHPQANPVERVNRVVKTMLAAYIGNDHRKWDQQLPKIAYAIRSARHEATGLTPNFIVFGREIDILAKGDNIDLENIRFQRNPTELLQRREALQRVFQDVKKSLGKAYERSRVVYNLRRRPDPFHVDQQVYRKNFVLSDAAKKFTAKLAPKYIGPYRITKCVSPYVYQLQDSDGKDGGIWSAKDLKASPSDDDPTGHDNNANDDDLR